MPRSLLSLLLTAVVATTAALGAVGLEQQDATANAADPAVSQAPPAPAALAPADPRTGLTPRRVAPRRDVDALATSPTRQARGTGPMLAASGTSRDPVDRGGRTVRFSVEVEAASGLDPAAVAAVAEAALYDDRSWARDHDLRRTAPADADIHVVVATPGTVDAMCARAGLRTAGWLSCWTGSTAAINLDRWTGGVEHFADLDQYRRYVINHEVGHGLGHDHRGCAGSGRLAPLMQQQTKSLGGCLPNEWRHPDG